VVDGVKVVGGCFNEADTLGQHEFQLMGVSADYQSSDQTQQLRVEECLQQQQQQQLVSL